MSQFRFTNKYLGRYTKLRSTLRYLDKILQRERSLLYRCQWVIPTYLMTRNVPIVFKFAFSVVWVSGDLRRPSIGWRSTPLRHQRPSNYVKWPRPCSLFAAKSLMNYDGRAWRAKVLHAGLKHRFVHQHVYLVDYPCHDDVDVCENQTLDDINQLWLL